MGVEYFTDHLDTSAILAALLDEFSAATDYCALRDDLPLRLTDLFHCHAILLYQRIDETLQFAAGSFADQQGWSSTLLAVAHINPIELTSEVPEARAWRTRQALLAGLMDSEYTLICAPLIYRQRAIGVLVAMRATSEREQCLTLCAHGWTPEDLPVVAVAANVVAMLLENTRLLERDRERIHELSLLNGISSQMNGSLRSPGRVQRIVLQRTHEIVDVDLCSLLLPELAGVDEQEAWISPLLYTRLWQHWQSDPSAAPLVLERVGEQHVGDYMSYLAPRIKTFFALPLLGNREESHVRAVALPYVVPLRERTEPRLLGVIVGAYMRPRRMRREELVLLQVLANQASAVLDTIALMDDVLEARNEARYLLHQALDDRRLKELILESIPSGLMTMNVQGEIMTFNRAAEAVLGYHPQEIIGQSVYKILDLSKLAEVLRGGQTRHETLVTRGRHGRELALDLTLALLRDEQGQPRGVLATFADVTSVYHLEEEKRRLDRLASLGEMSACVAHEVRNPLASIKTSMQMLRDDLGGEELLAQSDANAHESIAVVLKEVERLDRIVRDLLLFARPGRLHRVECRLDELSARVLHFLKPQCDEIGVRVRQVYQDLAPTQIDAAQMEQVLMNLFLNALQAMPAGGVLSVFCHVLPADTRIGLLAAAPAHYLPVETDRWAEPQGIQPRPGPNEQTVSERSVRAGWLELVISDTGAGIAPDDLERIFQPFHTTRAHGIGLGLPITRRLIEDHHGHIFVESQLGYGTTVSVRLPLSKEDKH